MNFKTSLLCTLVLSAVSLTAAQAQTSRAAVKADAIANAASEPMGQRSTPNQDKGDAKRGMGSTTSRDAVKSDAKAARAAGTIAMGEQSTPAQGKKPATRPTSTESRAEVKADAATAKRTGKDVQGQLSQKDQDKGVTKP